MKRTIERADQPSVSSLVRAVAGWLVVASVLSVTVVLPAEYGTDPTGVGGMLGLTAMGALKARPVPVAEPYVEHDDVTTLRLGPGQGTEVKASFLEGATLTYRWSTDGGELFYDFHGEPTGAAADVFTSHEKGLMADTSGVFTMPFDGTHGWYWKNKTDAPVTVRLETHGVYRGLKQLH